MIDRTQELELQAVPCQVQESEGVYTIERVSQALRTTCQWAFREIEVSVWDGIVHIEGQVTSYYQKQLAQEVVRKILPQSHVRNELNVVTRRDGRLKSCFSSLLEIVDGQPAHAETREIHGQDGRATGSSTGCVRDHFQERD